MIGSVQPGAPRRVLGMLPTSFDRSAAESGPAAALYVRSYLLIRFTVGLIGLLLPTTLFVLDGIWLAGSWRARDSLSIYYFTGARDIFVGALCVVGVLLITYLAGQKQTLDYLLSLIAGIAVIAVAFLPTDRPGYLRDLGPCTRLDAPALGCAALQEEFGERAVAIGHVTAAIVFVTAIGALCVLFGRREAGVFRWICFGCAVAIGCGAAVAIVGSTARARPLGFSALYLGEVIAVYAFGTAWLVKGRDVWRYRNRPGRVDVERV